MKKFMALIAFASLMLVGCTISKPVARQAMDFNLAFEKSKNTQMLLNVVRASLRLPTHYTALSQLLGTANNTFAPTGLIPFGGDAPSSYSLSLTNSATSGLSTVSMATLDSQTFTQGIMSPLTVDNLDYYEKQGWPKEMILLLLVHKLVIDGEEYVNQPTSDFKEIDRFLAKIRELEITVKTEAGGAVGPAFTLGANESLAGLILQGKSAGLLLSKVKQESGTASGTSEPVKYEFRSATGGKSLYIGENKTLMASETDKEKAEHQTVIFFRSTDGIFGYLGGILHYQDANNPKPKIRVAKEYGDGHEEVPLFIAEKAHKGNRKDAQVKAQHRGIHYVVPGKSNGRHYSMDVLKVLSQQISLHKSSSEIPSTGVVAVSGG